MPHEMESKDRRDAPRYKLRVPCSVTCADTGATLLTHTAELSLQAISLTIPLNPTYGAEDPSKVGTKVSLKLALPVGYVRLTGVLLRHQQADPKDHLFVFEIEAASDLDRRLYNEYVDALDRD
ncbi:MAG: PilZ domain-containing protein [Pyrinomonadaceae bacterium]